MNKKFFSVWWKGGLFFGIILDILSFIVIGPPHYHERIPYYFFGFTLFFIIGIILGFIISIIIKNRNEKKSNKLNWIFFGTVVLVFLALFYISLLLAGLP